MSNIDYQEEWYDEVCEDMKPLIDKHWDEIALHKDKIKLNPDWEMYEALNKIDRLRIFTAREGEELVGYFIVLIHKHMHYQDHIYALNDIIYIKPEKRGSTLAYRLIKYVEKELKDSGVSVLMVNMKTHAPFDRLMEGCGFSNVERVYSKYIGE